MARFLRGPANHYLGPQCPTEIVVAGIAPQGPGDGSRHFSCPFKDGARDAPKASSISPGRLKELQEVPTR